MGLHACPTFRHSLLKYLVLLHPLPSTHTFLRKIIPRKDFLVLSHQECSIYNLRSCIYRSIIWKSKTMMQTHIYGYIPVYSVSFSIFNLFLWFSIAINFYSTTFRIAGTAWIYVFYIGLYLISCLKKTFTHSAPSFYSEKYFINSLLVIFLLQDCSHLSIIPIINKQESYIIKG